MKVAVFALVFAGFAAAAAEAQTSRAGTQPAAASQSARLGEAYHQFLLGRHFESEGEAQDAIAAFKRAMELDFEAAEIPAELAALYLRMRRPQEAMAAAEQALKIAPDNPEAHRVLGFAYADLADGNRAVATRPRPTDRADENLAKAIQHFEQSIEHAEGVPDLNMRATLSRIYVRTGAYNKAIALLTQIVGEESGWAEGPRLLAEAYAGAGRTDEAVTWLEQAAAGDPDLYPALADLYERSLRWSDAARAYAAALQADPQDLDLKTRYASALLNVGRPAEISRARDTLTDVLGARPDNARALYLLAQAQRRLGDPRAAEATARRVIAQNAKSPWGYYALAEALEAQQQYQAIVDQLTPAVAEFRAQGGSAFELGLLLPHIGFAYQELGNWLKAIEVFGEAHQLAPSDTAVSTYLIQANLGARRYAAAAELARSARADKPDDLRLARLEAQALFRGGNPAQGIDLLDAHVKRHPDDPAAYIAMAQLCVEADRGAQAVSVLRDAESKFPANRAITFELGAAFDRQKRFADAEASFRRVLADDPGNAAALNYLGYMFAERGERLDESVSLIKQALELEPDNGSYLDSLGWAYFKSSKTGLAEENLKRAAAQLTTNSVVQDHYGDVLFKLGRWADAIAAWTRALAGDGESIVPGEIDRKIQAARQKLGRK